MKTLTKLTSSRSGFILKFHQVYRQSGCVQSWQKLKKRVQVRKTRKRTHPCVYENHMFYNEKTTQRQSGTLFLPKLLHVSIIPRGLFFYGRLSRASSYRHPRNNPLSHTNKNEMTNLRIVLHTNANNPLLFYFSQDFWDSISPCFANLLESHVLQWINNLNTTKHGF